jgi:hypothetical protein
MARDIVLVGSMLLLAQSVGGCASTPSIFETLERIEMRVIAEIPIGADVAQIEAASKKMGIPLRYDKLYNRYTGSVDDVERGVLGSTSVGIIITLDSTMRVSCVDTEIIGPASF